MLLGIDHLVVAVSSVEDAEAVLAADLGLRFTGGGRHEAWGTYNRLAFLGDTYIELIGVFDRALVVSGLGTVGRAALSQLEARDEGFATYALAVDNVAADVAALQADGSAIGSPVAGSRVRPDGEVVRWSTAWAGLGPEEPPFLIEHEPTGSEWGAAARAERATFRHPGGGRVRLEALELPVADADLVAVEYGRVLGIAFSEGWRCAIGEQALELCAGASLPTVRLTGDPGTEALDIERIGIRWVRVPAAG